MTKNYKSTSQELVQKLIAEECEKLKKFLLAKNKAYGNAAVDPIHCFSKQPAREQIGVRLDDKLSRIMRGEKAGEDPKWDIIGYLILDRVCDRLDEITKKKK